MCIFLIMYSLNVIGLKAPLSTWESNTMSCSTPNITTKDTNDDARSNSCFENVTTLDDQLTNSSLKSSTNDNISESVRLFKKYLLAKNQINMGTKTNWEVDHKSEFHRNTFRRRPSLLEQALLPRLRYVCCMHLIYFSLFYFT